MEGPFGNSIKSGSGNDVFVAKMSSAINKCIQEGYVLYSLFARSKASRYEGFSRYFSHEMKAVESMVERLTVAMVEMDNEISFNQIQPVSSQGSKVSDLVCIGKSFANASLCEMKSLIEYVCTQPDLRIGYCDLLNNCANEVLKRVARMGSIEKMLAKAQGDYCAVLAIDKRLLEECND